MDLKSSPLTRSFIGFFLASLLVSLLISCTVGTRIIGRWIDPFSVSKIENGITTEDKILYYFGRADDARETKEEKLLTYRYCEVSADGFSAASLSGSDLDTVCDFLRITIDQYSGLVTSHEFSQRK